MKLLLDVHIGTRLARMLTDAGHDVLRAALVHATAPDRELLELAVIERRIIITQDSDFSDLVYAWAAPPPPAIVYIRCEPGELTMMYARVLEVLESAGLDGHMVVMKPANTRYRPLPDVKNHHG
ncbi:MAG TPA: DUF5615 family PIN-like protein [Sphingomonas sp.]|nr:DUF5615 family PIN-like protein [Sphingomonas sp.]